MRWEPAPWVRNPGEGQGQGSGQQAGQHRWCKEGRGGSPRHRGAGKEGKSVGEAPRKKKPSSWPGRLARHRVLLRAEPLESQCGFQMKAIFALQNLKPTLPGVHDRDK